MSRPYNEWRYLWPPRPEHVVPADRLNYYEKLGWGANYKKNGTCSLIWLSPDGEFKTMNRHQEAHKAWQLGPTNADVLRDLLPRGKWFCGVAELMHNKAPNIKDTLYFHDVLVFNSEYLVGETYLARQKILEELFPANAEAYSHYVVSDRIWRAKLFTSGFEKLFKDIKDPKTDEGLVIKKLDAPLKMCDIQKANAGWSMKARHPAKNYAF